MRSGTAQRWEVVLLVTVDLPNGTKTPTTDFLGVDLGVANLATDSDGQRYSGDTVEAVRTRQHALRRGLQKAAAGKKRRGLRPKNIRRQLKRLSGKERRFRSNENHRIAKSLVAKAKGTERGIALKTSKASALGHGFARHNGRRWAAGLSISCARSSSTKPSFPAWMSCWFLPPTPARRAQHVAIRPKPTADRKQSSAVWPVDTPTMRM